MLMLMVSTVSDMCIEGAIDRLWIAVRSEECNAS